VERRDAQTICTGLGDDITERGNGKAVIGLEIVQDAAFLTVGENLVVNVQKNLLTHCLNLEARLVNEVVARRQPRGVLAAHVITQKPTAIGQILLGIGYFGQQHVLVFKGQHMASARNPNAQLIILVLDPSSFQNIEKLRMQRPAVKLKYQFRDARSNQERVHDATIDLPCR
jgi:hypothetical protein